MTTILLQSGIIFLLILLNGLFAMSEIAVVSSRRANLQQKAKEGASGAKTALELAKNPDRFLSTVQVGITLVGIFAGALGGATIARELTPLLAPLLGDSAEAVSLGLVVAITTYLSVVIGELVPKQIALQNPEGISRRVARPLQTLSVIATPVVKLLTLSTSAVVKLLGIPTEAQNSVTEEEIKIMVREGAREGIFEEAEQEMVEGVFRLGDYRLRSVMTPRPEIIWLDLNASQEKIREQLEQCDHSRFPVCDGDLDNPVGVVRVKNLLSAALLDEPFDLKQMIRDPIFLPESMPAIHALENFKQGTHLALIVDEYGGVEGLVTLYDILEAIVGDIPTSKEIRDPRITERDDGSWLIDGIIAIQDFKEYFSLETLPSEGKYETLAGFLVNMMNRIPTEGEHFGWGGYRFEVADMDGKRVDKILLTAAPQEEK